MHLDIAGLLESLNRIFDDNRPFYSYRMYEKEVIALNGYLVQFIDSFVICKY